MRRPVPTDMFPGPVSYTHLFYGTMGGQCGDTGVIRCADGEFEVKDTVHLAGGKIGHIGRMTKGMIKRCV